MGAATMFEEDLAGLWHLVANFEKFAGLQDVAAHARPGVLAHPGFVGPNYRPNRTGTLVVGMNRGGSSETCDVEEFKSLRGIRDRPTIEAFRSVNREAWRLLPTWTLWSRNLSLLFQRCEAPPEEIAYIHVVPFQVNDNAVLDRIYERCWSALGSKQIAALRPARVLWAGRGVGKRLAGSVPVKSKIVGRTLGDKECIRPDGSPNARRAYQDHLRAAEDRDFWR
jgi:hypothetical protein